MNQVRALSLDALRGLAILMMVLSGVVPYRVLPDWMYHAQLPPPTHAFDATLAGLTWVDLVFPMFLFAMGAAIPMALSRRLEKGISLTKINLGILERGLLLAFFAIFLQHVRPFTINISPDTQTWLTALAGFAILFAIYMYPPKNWSKTWTYALKAIGWTSALALLSWVTFADGSGFKLTRSDIIILVLANMAVFGSWAWLATRNNLLLRLGLMGILTACILAATNDGWVKSVWDSSPAPWLFRFYYLKYLFIIIPGTIAGEQLMQWTKALSSRNETKDGVASKSSESLNPESVEVSSIGSIQKTSYKSVKVSSRDSAQKTNLKPYENSSQDSKTRSYYDSNDSSIKNSSQNMWSNAHYYIITTLCSALVIVPVVGLHARWVTGTVIVCALLGIGLLFTMRSAATPSEQILKKVLSWGLFWLALGLCLEPFEGGIKKDVSTFSYYFVTTGISLFILVILMVVIDWFGKQKWVPLLMGNGQNPMIAYVGMMNLVYPVLGLTGLDIIIQTFTSAPWVGFLRGLVYTIILAWIVAIFTRKGIFWKT